MNKSYCHKMNATLDKRIIFQKEYAPLLEDFVW